LDSARSGWSPERRKTFLLRVGAGLLAAFLVLRFINATGTQLSEQQASRRADGDLLLQHRKSPSLLFLLMTLEPALLLLRAVDGGTPRLLRPRWSG
jgi:hypothetical protein